ncbi:GyrI-like domain-containing protein [Bacillus horti]|uniref:Transcriptional regulator YdeE n=1 Tax=Caldalkalibacillus horti TaxID=77523 RepID=A0ABT9VXZ8_9BACI|nr:GyrI-like domain-containing protein [Bacillus horti]MDQ0165754.1 putative transcriptional regulator YdeE [Bacillus horti]
MKVVELDEMMLVGIRVVCPGDQYVNEIPKATLRLKERLSEIENKESPARLIGAFIAGDYSDEEDGYWVCVEVNDVSQIPEGMVYIVVPKQSYAVVKHKGPNTEIRNTYERLHRWMEEQNLERFHKAWHLEIFEDWGVTDLSKIEVDLYDTIK